MVPKLKTPLLVYGFLAITGINVWIDSIYSQQPKYIQRTAHECAYYQLLGIILLSIIIIFKNNHCHANSLAEINNNNNNNKTNRSNSNSS